MWKVSARETANLCKNIHKSEKVSVNLFSQSLAGVFLGAEEYASILAYFSVHDQIRIKKSKISMTKVAKTSRNCVCFWEKNKVFSSIFAIIGFALDFRDDSFFPTLDSELDLSKNNVFPGFWENVVERFCTRRCS